MSGRVGRCAFTLVELIASMVIMSVLAGASASVLMRAGDAFGDATARRDMVSSASLAMDRVLHQIRVTPSFAAVSATGFECSSGLTVGVSGSTLQLGDAIGTSPLCEGVETFGMVYYDADGDVVDAADGDAAGRVYRAEVRIVVARGGERFETRGVATPRATFEWRRSDGS